MGLAVVDGAVVICSLGTAPSSLLGSGTGVSVQGRGVIVATDNRPDNVGTFGMCLQDGAPCTPVTPDPWAGSCTSIEIDAPVISASATLRCVKCGTISILSAGQATVTAESASDKVKDEQDGGGWVPDFVHDGLDIASNAPVVGGAAGGVNAAAYAAEGDFRNAAAEAAGGLAGLVPVPGARKLGRIAGGKVFRAGHKKPANPKVDFDGAEQVAARRRKQYVQQFDKYRDRGGKASGDVASNQIVGNPVKDAVAGDEDDDKGDDKDRRDAD